MSLKYVLYFFCAKLSVRNLKDIFRYQDKKRWHLSFMNYTMEFILMHTMEQELQWINEIDEYQVTQQMNINSHNDNSN